MMNKYQRPSPIRLLCCAGLVLPIVMLGCKTPFDSSRELELRRAVIDTVRSELTDAQQHPQPHTMTRKAESLPINKEFLPELEKMAGPNSHDLSTLDYGPDLTMTTSRAVGISLEHAIRSAVNNNLQVQFARLTPAINESDVVTAEAAFDWIFSSKLTYTNQDQINPSTVFNVSSGFSKRQELRNTTGIRKTLESGGQFSIQQQYIYTDFETQGLNFSPDPASQASVTLQLDQPLLRNFGSDVSLAQIRINRNTERDGIARLELQLIQTTNQTETAYWTLVRTHHELAILQRLLERGLVTRDRLQVRVDAKLDVPPSQLSDAVARVERRKNDVMRARNAVRDASDQLKVLLNDPNLPVGDETMLMPLDTPLDEPLEISLLDSLTTAIKSRPEIDQAILSIDNTSIRQTVAANQRLPQLDLQLQTKFNGLNDKLDVYHDMFNGKFIDYVVSLTFEQPIGNRAAEAGFVKRNLERQQAIISYRNTLQQVVRDVKTALRTVQLNYHVIEQARMSRLAATDSLRSLVVENKLTKAMSSERLDLEFNRQEALANAERTEIQAMTDFNTAVSQLQAAMGVSLKYNGIELLVPTPDQILPDRRSASWIDRLTTPASVTPPKPADSEAQQQDDATSASTDSSEEPADEIITNSATDSDSSVPQAETEPESEPQEQELNPEQEDVLDPAADEVSALSDVPAEVATENPDPESADSDSHDDASDPPPSK